MVRNEEQFKRGTVKVNWGNQFTPSRVRHLTAIKSGSSNEGYTSVGNHLPKEIIEQDYLYVNGDLFIITQPLSEEVRQEGNIPPCLFHLVQVDAESEQGYVILETVRESGTFPYPETKLVSKILQEPTLLRLVPVQ